MDSVRSGVAADWDPVASRRPKTTRLSPTPNSLVTGTGRKDAEAAGPIGEPAGLGDGAPIEPLPTVQPARTTRVAPAAASSRRETCMAPAYGGPLTRALAGGSRPGSCAA